MAHRRRRTRRFRHRRGSKRPSVSIATYSRLINLTATGSGLSNGNTVLAHEVVNDVENKTGETVNRKLLSISGELMFAAKIAAGETAVCMFAHLAHPAIHGMGDTPLTGDDSWDPFNDGPDGSTSYGGRLSPRPFGRRNFVLAAPPTGGEAEVVMNQHVYRTRAKRLLRPGWECSRGIYVRASSGVSVRLSGILRYSVAG